MLFYFDGLKTLSGLLVLLVAFLQIAFMYIEMVLWTRPYGLKAFKQTPEQANASKVLASNQGLYNGFLAVGLLWGLFHGDPLVGRQIQICFLSFVLVAGVYGGLTASRKILWVQALPSAIALALQF